MSQQKDTMGSVTMADVARRAGVATSSVSRALMQPERVSEEMRHRVQQAATELGYRPNPHARSLISGRSMSIALVIPDVTNPYFFDLIKGTQAQARARGYRNILVSTEESADMEASLLADLPIAVDGMIVAASRLPDADLLAVSRQSPLVVFNRDIAGVPSVMIDSPMGFAHAMDHLASLGHREVVYVSGPPSSSSNRQRWRAVQQSSRRLGMTAHQLGPFEMPSLAAGAAAADAVIHHQVTACLFFNDLLAIGALGRFRERGVDVPGDISVVGCDDIFGATFCHPPLTTLTAPVEQAGRVATDMLISSLPAAGGPLQLPRAREKLPTHLTIRHSTGAAVHRGTE